MRHQNRKKRLGLSKDHRTALLRNLTTSLIMHERIRTTDGRAKALAAQFGRLMKLIQNKEPREAIRLTPKYLSGKEASKKLIMEIKPRYTERSSGFTRITNIGVRSGDNATLVQIELI